MEYKCFETERLIIRPTIEEDAEFVLELLNSPKWIEYIGDREVRTLDAAKAYIQERMISQLKRLGFSNYTLIRKSDNHKIGACGLYDRPGFEGVDIGFALLPAYERKGYAYEAANRIKQAAFEDFKFEKISGITSKRNLASQKLLEKLGLVFVRESIFPEGEEEIFVYEITR